MKGFLLGVVVGAVGTVVLGVAYLQWLLSMGGAER
jgi:hypothetical protein